MKKLRTGKEVLADFDRHGMSVAGWAKAHGFERELVSSLLTGRLKGRRGKVHRAAVMLGMKDGVIDERL